MVKFWFYFSNEKLATFKKKKKKKFNYMVVEEVRAKEEEVRQAKAAGMALHSWKRYYALCILILLAHNVYSMEHA